MIYFSQQIQFNSKQWQISLKNPKAVYQYGDNFN